MKPDMRNEILSELDEDANYHYRPQNFSNFLGQSKLIENLQIFVKAARIRNTSLDHVLLYGPPGLGKTSLANIIANELNVNIKSTTGPAISKTADLAAILTNLNEKDVLFIDEIHRLNHSLTEILYPAMEDMHLDIIIGEGPLAKTIRIDLPNFTLIGATTRSGLLTKPLFDRFGIHCSFDFYDELTLAKITSQKAVKTNIEITFEACKIIAKSSRGTPRIAGRILKRISDIALVNNVQIIDENTVRESLSQLGIDNFGLDNLDRKYLLLIAKQFNGGPIGIETIASAMCESSDLIEDVIEPFLLRKGFIERTPRGRVILPKGESLIGVKNKLL